MKFESGEGRNGGYLLSATYICESKSARTNSPGARYDKNEICKFSHVNVRDA